MAWKPDNDVVAIGNSNGYLHTILNNLYNNKCINYCQHFCCRSIYLLDGITFKLQHVIHGHDQSVECIIWHPTHVTCDYSEESKFKNYFASSSHCIRVHQLNEGTYLVDYIHLNYFLLI